MSKALVNVTTEFLQAFADAWNRHDVDALMSFMIEDCVFKASASPYLSRMRATGKQWPRSL